MPRRYLETRFQVAAREDAAFLQNPHSWQITQAIINAGATGITSGEIAEELDISYRTVAETARRLAQMRWITSEPPKRRLGRPSRGEKRKFTKPANLHVWAMLRSFDPVVREDFAERCFEVFDKYGNDLRPYIGILERIVSDMKSTGQYYPTEPIHECGWSHEAFEFVRGILYAFLDWVEHQPDFRLLMKNHDFAEEKAFEEGQT